MIRLHGCLRRLQVPPGINAVNVVATPWHTAVAPDSVAVLGTVLTVITQNVVAVVQLLVTAYIMVSISALTPLNKPADEMVTCVFDALQLPLPEVSVRVTDEDMQTDVAPEIVPELGKSFTVIAIVAVPLLWVTKYITVLIAWLKPVTIPAVETIALVLVASLVPPEVVGDKVIIVLAQTVNFEKKNKIYS